MKNSIIFYITGVLFFGMNGQKNEWEYVGPKSNHYQYRGLFQSVWSDRSNLNTVMAGSHSGGLFVTKNALSQNPVWENITENLPYMNFGVSGIAVKPNTENQTIYISTYTGNGLLTHGFGAGIFYTVNGGKTWKRIGPGHQDAGKKENQFPLQNLKHNPENFAEMAAWYGKDLFLTRNEWNTFRKASLPFHTDIEKPEICDVEYAPFEPGKMYATTKVYGKNKAQLFVSYDYGNSWTDITPKDVVYERIEIAPILNPVYKGRYYIAYGNTDVYLKYFNGKEFSPILNSYFINHLGAKTYWCFSVDVNSVDTSIIYVSMTETSRSTDGGKSFIKIGTYNGPNTHADIRASFLAISTPGGKEDKLLLANDGGISLSQNFEPGKGTFFRSLNGKGLYANEFWGIDLLQNEKLFISGGTQDNGAFFIKENIESNNIHACGDAYMGLPVNDSLAVSVCFPPLLMLHNIYQNSNTQIRIPDEHCDARRPLFRKDSFVYVAYHDIWQAKVSELQKGNLQFKNISQIPFLELANNHVPNKAIKSFALSPFNSVLLVYLNPNWENENKGKLYFCENILASKPHYVDITSSNNTAKAEINRWYQMESITSDNKNKYTFYYLAKDVFDATNCIVLKLIYLPDSQRVFLKDITYNLPKTGYNRIKTDPLTNVLYLAANEGVFSLNIHAGDTVWKNHNFFPHVQTSDIAFNLLTNTLFVATFGRGIWKNKIPDTENTHTIISNKNSSVEVLKADGSVLIKRNCKIRVEEKLIICGKSKIQLGKKSKLILSKKCKIVDSDNNPLYSGDFLIKGKKSEIIQEQ